MNAGVVTVRVCHLPERPNEETGMPTRIVVADQSEARFYDFVRRNAPLRAAGVLANPAARRHDRDLGSDRPGRVFDRAPQPGQRRGAVSRHGTGGERSPRKHEAEVFARRVVRELGKASRDGRFDRLVLVAAPAFLGLLRAALPKGLKPALTATVAKDLIHEPEDTLRSKLPDEAFKRPRAGART
jgi:protein required for attachment to host cells